jgi:hypothetical protein
VRGKHIEDSLGNCHEAVFSINRVMHQGNNKRKRQASQDQAKLGIRSSECTGHSGTMNGSKLRVMEAELDENRA